MYMKSQQKIIANSSCLIRIRWDNDWSTMTRDQFRRSFDIELVKRVHPHDSSRRLNLIPYGPEYWSKRGIKPEKLEPDESLEILCLI